MSLKMLGGLYTKGIPLFLLTDVDTDSTHHNNQAGDLLNISMAYLYVVLAANSTGYETNAIANCASTI
ncbi:hypothetical protein SCA6_014941 [Theobroma cacao]